jgi:hypothetical protein
VESDEEDDHSELYHNTSEKSKTSAHRRQNKFSPRAKAVDTPSPPDPHRLIPEKSRADGDVTKANLLPVSDDRLYAYLIDQEDPNSHRFNTEHGLVRLSDQSFRDFLTRGTSQWLLLVHGLLELVVEDMRE